jgi:predicted thioesterase
VLGGLEGGDARSGSGLPVADAIGEIRIGRRKVSFDVRADGGGELVGVASEVRRLGL